MAVVKNPFADSDQEDLSQLFEFGTQPGEQLTSEIVGMLSGPPI